MISNQIMKNSYVRREQNTKLKEQKSDFLQSLFDKRNPYYYKKLQILDLNLAILYIKDPKFVDFSKISIATS